MRKKIVAGNWKMNKNLEEGIDLSQGLMEEDMDKEVEVILIPPFIHLSKLAELLAASSIKLGAQNSHQENSGAYTGEISAPMLKSCGVEYCLVGHSERRQYNGEGNELLKGKLMALLAAGIQPIFCCGEHLEERKSGKYFDSVKQQLSILFELQPEEMMQVIIAYEPVWAIGTGETASAEQAQEMHAFIRKEMEKHYGADNAQQLPILYGGSCNPANAKELFSQKDVDGGLIGGASLKITDFTSIINSF